MNKKLFRRNANRFKTGVSVCSSSLLILKARVWVGNDSRDPLVLGEILAERLVERALDRDPVIMESKVWWNSRENTRAIAIKGR